MKTTIHDLRSTIHAISVFSRFKYIVTVFAAASLMLTAGCVQEMANQPRYEAFEANTFFEDSLAMRPLPAGVVPRSATYLRSTVLDAQTNPYYTEEGEYLPGAAGYEQRLVDAFPFEVTMEVLERGQQQYNIYCSPCHGRTGYGNGMVVQRGFRKPPSYHTERLRNAPVGHFYNVITNGYGAMFSYAARVAPADRWAIAAYIRALQLSQHAPLETLPPETLTELQLDSP